MINRIKISEYKSLEDVEINLSPLSILVGPNGAGKSNFLDALQLLSKIATSRTLKEAFEPPYRGKPLESFTFTHHGIAGLLEKDRLSFSIEVDVELSQSVIEAVNRQIREMKRSGVDIPGSNGKKKKLPTVRENYLRYRIEVEILPRSGFLRVVDEYLGALTRKGEPTASRRPFLSREGERLHLRLEGQAHPTYYERFLDHSILSLPHYPPHYPHLAAMRKELESWLFFYFEPRERMRAANPVKEVRHIGLMGEELPAFLNTLKTLDPSQFKAVEKALSIIVPNIEGIVVDVNNLGEVELRLIESGIPIPARVLSEGTLRLLGLLALTGAKEPPSLIGFEEPENGIHPRRIRLIAELLKTRASFGHTQYIVTTHSPLLPDLVEDETLYICRKEDGMTRMEPFSTWGPLGRKRDIDEALLDGEEPEELTISERMLRGDFDA
ncbi:RecF/RecN/SMC N-terminal domain protein [delta proteobacterium NaphS2]|nr:RecF/RecN/SMC N-terminal domain protein [delta proteobacterium NaphS2]